MSAYIDVHAAVVFARFVPVAWIMDEAKQRRRSRQHDISG
jgi:hypothetical protein